MLVLDSLGLSDLKIISLTCQQFRSLAISRLFRCLSIGISRGSVSGLGVDRYCWGIWKLNPFDLSFVEPMTLSTMHALLAFYGSEHIAPLVREFRLAAYDGGLLQPSIEVVLDLLHRFSNVRSVGLTLSNVTPRMMETIAQLPALASVIMDSCTYHHSEEPLLRLKDVSLSRLYSSYEDGTWPFTVQPELLESLHVDGTTFPNFTSLPNLITLRILRTDSNPTTPVIRCLKFLTQCHCPSLETLILPTRYYGLDGELATVDRSTLLMIPRLKVYHGPSSFIPLFATGGLLRHASLWESSQLGNADSLDILHALAPNLVKLTVNVVSRRRFVATAHAIRQFRDMEKLYVKAEGIGGLETMQACTLGKCVVILLTSVFIFSISSRP
jgi:hypothetical protein